VRETDDRFELTVDLPGIESGDVTVNYEDGMLSISGKREFSKEESGETWHRVERGFGTFARQVRLPRTADADRIEASFDKGVLTVSVPKAEAAKPRTIEVKAT
jgi:HSP20 family protein